MDVNLVCRQAKKVLDVYNFLKLSTVDYKK